MKKSDCKEFTDNLNIDKPIYKQKNTKKPLNKWIITSIVLFILAYYISNNWYQLMLIQGESMSPSYHNLQMVILNRHSSDYTYGDVVAFKCERLDSVLVKRIVACPCDVVVIDQGTLYVNGDISAVFPETGLFEYEGILDEKIQLGTGQYIVIGDNTRESKDSRYEEVGYIDESNIIGKVVR